MGQGFQVEIRNATNFEMQVELLASQNTTSFLLPSPLSAGSTSGLMYLEYSGSSDQLGSSDVGVLQIGYSFIFNGLQSTGNFFVHLDPESTSEFQGSIYLAGVAVPAAINTLTVAPVVAVSYTVVPYLILNQTGEWPYASITFVQVLGQGEAVSVEDIYVQPEPGVDVQQDFTAVNLQEAIGVLPPQEPAATNFQLGFGGATVFPLGFLAVASSQNLDPTVSGGIPNQVLFVFSGEGQEQLASSSVGALQLSYNVGSNTGILNIHLDPKATSEFPGSIYLAGFAPPANVTYTNVPELEATAYPFLILNEINDYVYASIFIAQVVNPTLPVYEQPPGPP